MQSPHDTSRGHSYHRHQPSLPSTHSPNYPDQHHSGQAVGYHHPVMSNVQLQRPYGAPQDQLHSGMRVLTSPIFNIHSFESVQL